jgi:hypothetical protein
MQAAERQDEIDAMLAALEKIQLPQFSSERYSPQQLELSGYETPEEINAKLIQIDPSYRAKQFQSIENLKDLGEGYGASRMAADMRQAEMQANQLAQGREQAALMNAQARGVGGSGLEFALGQQGSQEAANRAMLGGMNAAQAAALNRLQTGQGYLQGITNLRQQDTDLESRNADAINKYNAMNVVARNAARQSNIDNRNKAAMENWQASNAAQQANLDRSDRIKQSIWDMLMRKNAAETGIRTNKVEDMWRQAKRDTEQGEKQAQRIGQMMSMAGRGGSGGGMGGGFGGIFGGS